MLNNLNRIEVEAGSILFSEGDPGDCAYLIEEGSIEIFVGKGSQSRQVNIIGKGELFGEVALIDHQPRTASARAVNKATLIPISRTMVNELLEKTDPIVRHLLLVILERYRNKGGTVAATTEEQLSVARKRNALRGEATQKITLANDIARALEKDEFELFYQPICDLKSEHVAGYEALIRWHHPLQGMISPLDFLWLAEQTGQIRELGLWTLKRACRDWPVLRRSTHYPRPFVSVNLSPSQLTEPRFVEDVKTVMQQYQMSPGELKLELTETVIINNPELALKLLRQITLLGSSIALDDFGTGHSGLDSLNRYPIGTMKIDRAFISQIHDSAHSREIVQTSIKLAHSLGMDVVAEGIETREIHAQLLALQCNYGQGWLYGKPVPLARIDQ